MLQPFLLLVAGAVSAAFANPASMVAAVPSSEDERDRSIFGEVGASPVGTSTATGPSVEDPFAGRERASRDDEVFGASAEPTPSASPSSSGSQAAAAFGALDGIWSKLEDSKRFLELGGQLWLWLEYNALYEGEPQAFGLRAPSFVDLYADARPNDRVRGFVQGRLRHDFTVRDGSPDAFLQRRAQTQAILDQLYVKTDLGRVAFLTLGRQRVRWGVGRFWNPTDFLNAARRDPLAVFDQRIGVSLLRVHVPVESLGWNFYAIANLEEAARLDAVRPALRGEFLLGQTEWSLSASFGKDEPTRLGADVSTGIGWVDLKAELALQRGVRTPFFRGPLDVAGRIVPDMYFRDADWIPQGVLCGELSIPLGDGDSLILGAEYFYNDAGYADEKLYPWLLFQRAFVPLYAGRHYAGAFVFLPSPLRWDETSFLLSGIGNLSDGSFLARFDYSVQLYSQLQLRLFAAVHLGSEGELKLRIDVPPTEFIPELADGFALSAPLLDVGAVLSLSL